MSLLAALALACSGAGSTLIQQPTTGSIDLRMTSALMSGTRVTVTIDRLTARFDCCGASDIAFPLKPIDLGQVSGEAFVDLGAQMLPASRMTEVRVFVGEIGQSWIEVNGKREPLVVRQPEDGISIPTDVRLQRCATGHLTFVFAQGTSVQLEGDHWVLNPVLMLTETVLADAPCGPGMPLP